MLIWMSFVAAAVFTVGLLCWTGRFRRWFVYPWVSFIPPTLGLGFGGLGAGWMLLCIALILPESSSRAPLASIGMFGGLFTFFLFGNFWPRRWWPRWMKDVAEEREREIEAKRRAQHQSQSQSQDTSTPTAPPNELP